MTTRTLKRKMVSGGFESQGIAKALRSQSPMTQEVKAQIQANRNAALLRRTLAQRPLQRNGNFKQESGYVDLAAYTAAGDSTGSVTLIATVAQGTSVSQRVGKKIRWESIQVRGTVTSASGATWNKGALIFVYDKRPTGALPTVSDILVSPSSYALNNDTNSGRFQILRRLDHLCIGPMGANPPNGREGFVIDEFIKVRRPCVFKAGGTGAIGDIEEGALYVVAIGQNVIPNNVTYTCGIRVRYTDI